MSRDLLRQIDERAGALGLNRSQYFAQLVRADLVARGAMVLREQGTSYEVSPEAAKAGNTEEVSAAVAKSLLGLAKSFSALEAPGQQTEERPLKTVPGRGRKAAGSHPKTSPEGPAHS